MVTTAMMIGAQFDALPYEEGRQWELLDGDVVSVSSPTLDDQEIVFLVLAALKQHLAGTDGVASHDVEFRLSEDTRVRPDVWVLLSDKASAIDTSKVPLSGCPDLAVEVISESEHTADSMGKVDCYLRHGTPEVWQIYPKTRLVVAYTQTRDSRTFTELEVITTPLLPSFELPVSSLFRR